MFVHRQIFSTFLFWCKFNGLMEFRRNRFDVLSIVIVIAVLKMKCITRIGWLIVCFGLWPFETVLQSILSISQREGERSEK